MADTNLQDYDEKTQNQTQESTIKEPIKEPVKQNEPNKKEIPTNSSDSKAHEMAKSQREISIAEFFEKNRHLLGFDNKRKALLTTIKEAVDNSLDACEEADILPEIIVEIHEVGNDKYRVIIEDNGPGIIKAQIPKIFAKLLYGSKFHKLKMQRGQQGIGISAAVMYAQLTTGKPAKIISKIHKDEPAHYYELKIDTATNKPDIVKDDMKEWYKDHGTRIEIDLEASYNKGNQSVDEYIRETAVINPHVTLIYQPPKGEQLMLVRATEQKPKQAQEIKPHPYGVELGMLIKMLNVTEAKTIKQFLKEDFSRVGDKAAEEILENSKLLSKTKTKNISRDMAEQLMEGIKKTKLMMPPTDCIVPLGEEMLEKGIKKEINAEFYTSVSRPPAVYRGNPFAIEVAIAYGGDQPSDKAINVMRFANRVPLLYQQGACATQESITQTNWKSYGINQTGSNMPTGPITVVIHIASVWVPFTSEAKEAIAHYPEIIKEMKLAIQEAGRNLAKYVKKKKRVKDELKKRSYIETYIPHIAEALRDLTECSATEEEIIKENLTELLEQQRGKVDSLDFDPTKNEEYDEDFAKIGREKDEEDEEDDQEENGEEK
ncbi:DNA topoisomerase VI subunit B [Candidatus Woesearchaeota archaeon]|nr:DNA topoisomerase VI subunit B [Candidatus Woesearchaeota archaeon]MCF7900916.1 DNA topoisomerase VI subunit B [Candidatus Woesearchaeota archaeon]MCF8013035.1 DNA topoisomerase VI subunit B [Candidatus Woesearchaeota archaeon]